MFPAPRCSAPHLSTPHILHIDLPLCSRLQAARTACVAPVVLKPVSDPRLRRLAERQKEEAGEPEDSDDGLDRRRAAVRRHASIAAAAGQAGASDAESSEDESGSEEAAEEQDEDDIAARRAAVKARYVACPDGTFRLGFTHAPVQSQTIC